MDYVVNGREKGDLPVLNIFVSPLEKKKKITNILIIIACINLYSQNGRGWTLVIVTISISTDIISILSAFFLEFFIKLNDYI